MGDEYRGGRPGAGAITPVPQGGGGQGEWGGGYGGGWGGGYGQGGEYGGGWGGPTGGGWGGATGGWGRGQPPMSVGGYGGGGYGGGGYGGGYGGGGWGGGGRGQAPPPASPPAWTGGYGGRGMEYNGVDIGSNNTSELEGNNVKLRFDLSKLKDIPKLAGGVRIGSGQYSKDKENTIDFSEYNDPAPPPPPPPQSRSQVVGIGIRFGRRY